ncbi:DNA polymerase phi [Nitzschia inconspicua]|uniref:DNA polymerase phi n=1 Tax=Nitzschia inconspicua TaxID=303405 RepID=A0A9K3PEG3_9STRA|nr:DNA polymerase phi [Nitzschia inconspicua]
MRKRKNSSSEEEEGSEMEIQGEAKMSDQVDSDDEEDIEMVDPEEEEESEAPSKPHLATTPAVDNPFMDSFYALSSSVPVERAQAAQTMLQHCLLSSSANSKDAAYSFRRLLNGLCSGRAAARQGNASALASFLKLAFHLEKIKDIRSEADQNKSGDLSNLMYIRERLLTATDTSQIVGKKKGSEERDYQFGRLFGILAVVRSKILVPSSANVEDVKEVTTAFLSDLVELFWEKKWMREPAAHGITTMLQLFLDGDEEHHLVARDLVHTIVVPKLLAVTQDDKDFESSDRQKLLEGYCAEQIGVAVYVQSNYTKISKKLPFPLDQAVVSSSTLPWIAQALSETSSVVHPRTHFVWDALWCLLTIEQDSTKDNSRDASARILLDRIPLSSESGTEVLDAILRHVLKAKLLRIEEDSSPKKITHERRSLALCIVRNLSGVPFLSSLAGQVRIELDGDCIENVLLTPEIVQALFLNVITGGRQKQNASLLKPMALEILGGMSAAVVNTSASRQLSYAKAILRCDSRFDAHTKTSTLTNILGLASEKSPEKEDFSRWSEFLDHLEFEFLSNCSKHSDIDANSLAINFAEVIYSTAKSILRTGVDAEETSDSAIMENKENAIKRVLNFFMAVAFFDCSEMQSSTGKKKKGKKNTTSPAVSKALVVKEQAAGGIPYEVRSVVAARFFSLTSEFAMVVAREVKAEDDGKAEKDTNILAFLADICDSWQDLQKSGSKRFETAMTRTEEDDNESFDPEEAITALRKSIRDIGNCGEVEVDDPIHQSKKRCCTGITVLALTMYLHRLHCGVDASMDEDPDADEEDDEEEICNALEGLKSLADDFLGDEEPEDSNPLLGLAELCANVLSSPIGSGSIGRGCSPKLVREAVRYAWLGGLRLASARATENKSLLDSSVIDVLMEAVGADSSMEGNRNNSSQDVDDDDESASAGDSDEEKGDVGSGDEAIFTKASKIMEDVDDMEVEEPNVSSAEDEDSEVEIDQSKLQHMLEEDSEADIDETELEHHEGADAALAKLIKLRQEARKAGQQAREKIEVSNQLRCTLLLEILLGRPDAWNRLFRSSLLEMVMPLLLHRQRVAVMVQKAVDGGSKVGTGEKRALLERLTSIIKQKLCKLRLSSMPLANTVDTGAGRELVKAILREVKKAKDKDQAACCSACLVFLLRAMPNDTETIAMVSSEYGQVVHEWSTKRSSGASLIEDLINQLPSLAQATLLEPLTKASLESRSSFLRLESFRLLSILFSVKDSTGHPEMQKLAEASVERSQQQVLDAIFASLDDEEMCKPKRARVIFKTLEKFLVRVTTTSYPDVTSSLKSLKEKVETLGQKNDSGGKGNNLSAATSKLVGLIDDVLTEQQKMVEANKGASEEEEISQPDSKNKKSKKKKKKKR